MRCLTVPSALMHAPAWEIRTRYASNSAYPLAAVKAKALVPGTGEGNAIRFSLKRHTQMVMRPPRQSPKYNRALLNAVRYVPMRVYRHSQCYLNLLRTASYKSQNAKPGRIWLTARKARTV